jgi:hypothetical protein
MATQIRAARAKSRMAARVKLTPYESDQVAQIAAWKSQSPNPVNEILRRITLPGANLIEKVIPEAPVRAAIEQTFRLAALLASKQDIKRRAGVNDLGDLRKRPLEDCDHLAIQMGIFSQVFATAEGAITGAGGVLTTLIDIPLLFVLSLWTILRIGHCYGYPLAQPRDRHFVLGVLIAAMSGTLETKKKRLDDLHELEDLLIEETQEEIIAEEVLSFLFQLEILAGIPGIGTLSGAALNLISIRRVENTARRIFQERWLKDSGKVQSIAAAEVHARDVARGWAGALGRLAYSGCYSIGFGAALPASILAPLFSSEDNAALRGIRDGRHHATASVGGVLNRATARVPRGARARRRAARALT